MGIAGFSPSVFCAPRTSTLLAPVQALMALFMPVQPIKANRHSVVRAPELRTPVKPNPVKSNLVKPNPAEPEPAAVRSRQTTCLRVTREFDPCNKRSHAGRMVISGRMADVCAELDRIALKESA